MKIPAAGRFCQLLVLSVFFHFNDAVCAYWTLCVSPLVKCLLKGLFTFQTGFSVLLNFKILFYFTVTSPLLDMCITDPFPQHVECLFIILMGAFENSSFLILVNSSLSFFFLFIVHAFCVLLENLCLFQSCKSFLN